MKTGQFLLTLTVLCASLATPPAQAQPKVIWAWGFGKFAEMEQLAEAQIKSPADQTVRNLVPLCIAHAKVKRYNRLGPCIEKLEERVRAGQTVHEDSMVFTSDITPLPDMLRAVMSLDFGDYAKTLEYGERALSVVKTSGIPGMFGGAGGLYPPHSYPIELLPHMAIAAVQLGQTDRARAYLDRLAAVNVPYMGSALYRNLKETGLARIHMALGQHDRALVHLKEEHMKLARGIANALIGGGKDRDTMDTLIELPRGLMMSRALIETGQRDEARKILDTLLANPRSADHGEVHWLALAERGRLADLERDTTRAIEVYTRAVEVVERQRATIHTEASKIGFVGDKQKVYARLIALLVAAGRAEEAFDYVERSKARALVDLLASRENFAVGGGVDADKVKQVLAQLKTADSDARLQSEIAMANAANGGASGQRMLAAARENIQGVAPELASLVTVMSVPPAQLRALLAPDEALVEYYLDEQALYAFILTRDTLTVRTLAADGLTAAVQDMRRAVEDAQSQRWRASARQLHQRLIEPLQPALAGRRLVIVPHGVLHYLPFAALLGADERALIDDHAFRLAPSASVLKYIKPSVAGSRPDLLAFGNPDLGNAKFDLEFAESEVKALAGMVPEARVLLRREASETAFRKAAPLFRRIHLASHGQFKAERPLDSGLFLARDGEHDGVLTVGELYTLSLDADLVTLSACETGLGQISHGDDVVGLARGFLYAGARSIVASLWSVDDQATSGLMQAFYRNLASAPRHEALRQAQMEARKAFPHPFYWAAFQLTGRPD